MNPPSPSPAQDDNFRRLLDQRAARADVHHTRFPSLTEFSDSPSIYSHPRFSPRTPHLDSSPPQFDFAIPPRYAARPAFNATTMRSLASSASSTTTTDTQHGLDGPPNSDDVRLLEGGSVSLESMQAEDEELESRMSFLGPTIQFHTLAPWETEDNITDRAEQEDDARSFVTKRGKSKTRGDGFIKGLSKPASAKATSTARPSFESTISRDKVSLDSQTVPSIFHAQSQATSSSSSSSATSSSRPSRPFIFSRGRSRTVSHTPVPDTSVPTPPPLSPSSVFGSSYPSPTSPVPTRSASPDPSMYSTQSPIDGTDASRPTSPLSFRGRPEFVHPYANPDLAYDGGHVNTASSYLPPSSLGRRMIVPSDSIPSVSESGVSQSSTTLTPDSSMSSVTDYHADVLLKKVVGSVQGRLISGPLSTGSGGQKLGSQPGQDKGQFALSNQVPTMSPTFNLISLQEAQAQARERSRTHIHAMPDPPFLQNEPPSRNNAPALPSNLGRMRSRTASASSKGKAEPPLTGNPFPLPHSNGEDSAPNGRSAPPRTLKQKKSGFMRLFNGKDKDKTQAPSASLAPPVTGPSMPRTPKLSSARVPVPTLSPSLVPQSPLQLDSIVKGDGRENDPVGSPWEQESIQQQVPALTIITTRDPSPSSCPPSSQSLRVGTGGSSMMSGLSPDRGLSPASAPPLTTTFPGLSLRPISTVFSAHFADHIMSLDSPSTSTTQTDSSSTTAGGSGSGGSLSPLATEPSFDDKHVVPDDDPYVIIQQLQEQLRSTRKAWQHQIWELEGQVRDLRGEIDEMRLKELRGERCILCGRSDEPEQSVGGHGVVDRPRARTGVGTMRFAAAP